MKIITIIGARPQFIKAATVSYELSKYNDVKEIIVHTGQHFDKNMSEVFFQEMKIPKIDYNLNINKLSHGAMTGRMIEKLEKILLIEKPDWVIVYGDTNSTLAGALAAKKLHIKLAHIEAGLRSFNMEMPEEINRILTDRISDILFCPTKKAVENLKSEGFDNFKSKNFVCGDVMYDAAVRFMKLAKKPEGIIPDNFILATVHRAENTNKIEKLKDIFKAFNIIANKTPIVFPMHPRTKHIIKTNNISINNKNIIIIPPVSYLEMIYLLKNCNMVMTDSGGVQKEAFFFKKACITLRKETEWIELVENGVNIITDSDTKTIIGAFNEMNNKKIMFDFNPYGNGNAAKIIVNTIVSSL